MNMTNKSGLAENYETKHIHNNNPIQKKAVSVSSVIYSLNWTFWLANPERGPI